MFNQNRTVTARLVFVPKPGTNVNHDDMFKHYVENYLSGFSGKFGGYISVETEVSGSKRTGVYYQYVITECLPGEYLHLVEYLERNPIHGYWVDIRMPNWYGNHHSVSRQLSFLREVSRYFRGDST